MEDWFGVAEWQAKTIWVVACLAVTLAAGFAMHWRARRRLVVKRQSPTRETFVFLLSGKVDADIAAWLWTQLLPYYRPLTPHPDDHLRDDAMIDDDEIDSSWRPDLVRDGSSDEIRWPEWPDDWDLTVVNYARWLQLARDEYRGALPKP